MFQFLSGILAYVVTSRVLPFLIGLGVGGMLTLSSPQFAELMEALLSIWQMVVEMVIGR